MPQQHLLRYLPQLLLRLLQRQRQLPALLECVPILLGVQLR
jgi:hypothetical protein